MGCVSNELESIMSANPIKSPSHYQRALLLKNGQNGQFRQRRRSLGSTCIVLIAYKIQYQPLTVFPLKSIPCQIRLVPPNIFPPKCIDFTVLLY